VIDVARFCAIDLNDKTGAVSNGRAGFSAPNLLDRSFNSSHRGAKTPDSLGK
jgi:hypothetical protein